jgi:hypothetical protein
VATAAEITRAIDAQIGGDTGALELAGRKVIARWGALLERYRGHIPLSLAAVRIGHETGGNPRATSSNQEKGLLQVWPWLATKYKIDPYDPASNLWAGFDDWNARSISVAEKFSGIVGAPDRDFWALSNCTMSVGAGATRRLVRHVNGGHSAVLAWIRANPNAFLALPQSWWGTQSHVSVAKRWASTERWIRAAERIAPVISPGFGRKVPREGCSDAAELGLVVALLGAAQLLGGML